jgi:hypothetical protein
MTAFRAAVWAACIASAASCAPLPSAQDPSAAPPDALAARVEAILARRGLGRDALAVIDNVLRHEAPPPPFAPPLVRELLARPLDAVQAAALFDRAVPRSLVRFVDEAQAIFGARRARESQVNLRELIDRYVDELAAAQRLLRTASSGAPLDSAAVIEELRSDLPSAATLQALSTRVDQATLARATRAFIEATARFVAELNSAGAQLVFPDQGLRLDSPIGTIVIGTRGNDVHGPDAALIIDPGGNDIYERRPATEGAISVIVDLGGDDQYRGSDLALQAFSAIVDLAGNDRYAMQGPGLGATLGGASLVVDFAGDDVYEADLFGEGAAAFGLGAVIDVRGDDRYRMRAGGQGFATAGGVGLLWDGAGNDRYEASGIDDAFGRGGVSFAQGAAYGLRNMLGGGIGILRDDAGDDRHEAQLFAQGAGYYQSVGLLWDRAGNDRYSALRYAQGAGVHEALGVLRDEAGNDRYALDFGVGQGMGLDLAVGVLFDGKGDDRYRASVLAQGGGSANGLGILIDGGGADAWQIGADRRAWGAAEWWRGLPSVGILLYEPERAAFVREGNAVPPRPEDAGWGGPLGDARIAQEAEGEPRCPQGDHPAGANALSLAESLRRIAPGFAGARVDAAVYADVVRQLAGHLEASLAQLPGNDFNVSYPLGAALRCALRGARAEAAAAMWTDMERVVQSDPATPFASALLGALRDRPAPPKQMGTLLDMFDRHPACGVRSAALALRNALAVDQPSQLAVQDLARVASHSPCWRLQAEAITVLRHLGATPEDHAARPSFLPRALGE